ncbi:hypothetical protein JTB14_023357 [Gonioctena quinquepunctata]|nr:hypothetical protein JTB14_023357 [Gonioctena quinquepunctata]
MCSSCGQVKEKAEELTRKDKGKGRNRVWVSAPPTPTIRNPGKEFETPDSISQEDHEEAENRKAVIDTNTPKTNENKKNTKPTAGGLPLKERTRSQRSIR